MSCQVVPIPVLEDNYAYLLIDKANNVAAAIDPVDAKRVYEKAIALNVRIVSILTTHGHWDHAGGNEDLVRLLSEREDVNEVISVFGGVGDDVQAATNQLSDQDVISIGELEVKAYHTPCHTRGHVLYHCQDVLFTGDTLFIAGCGRFFQGTPAEMHHALNNVVGKLPLDTKIYCGHEYTLKNLRFAASIEPGNIDVMKKLSWAETQKCTIPSSVREELATNPFMRVHEPTVSASTGQEDPVEVLRILRQKKDQF